jgi:hydroxypyruvate reductase
MDPSQRTASLSRDWHGLRILAGSNHLALMTAAHIARREGLSIEVLPEFLSDDAEVVGKRLAERARDSAADVILAGGEPLVELGDAPGRGGRLGVLTLAYGLAERREPAAPLLTLASDGADGASQGAGAFWLPGPFDRHLAQRALAERDSDRFFQRAGWLLKLPATGANVRDLAFVLTHPEKIAREP